MKRSLLMLTLLFSSAQALDQIALQKAAQYSRENRGSALLVLQNGQEIFAEGQNGFALSTPHFLASGSKSFGCALAVVLQQEGKLKLDEKVADTLAEWRQGPLKSQVTVRELLHFSSGLEGKAGPELVRLNQNLYQSAVNAPIVHPPGTVFTYGNAHLAVFGELVKRKTGMDPAVYLQQKVLDPLGVKALWQRDQSGNPNLAGSASMTARDWARYGQLILQKGQWNGKEVLSEVFLQGCFQGSEALAAYGLNFWLNVPFAGTLDEKDQVPVRAFQNASGMQKLAEGAPEDMVFAAGAFNQRMYILPSQGLVVVRFAEGGNWNDDVFLRLLLELSK